MKTISFDLMMYTVDLQMKINFFSFVLRYFSLFVELTKREFSARYKASYGGVFWAFVQPLFLLSVYTVAFGVILKARWGFAGSTWEYALILFAGLIVFNACSEVLIKSTTLITANPNFVKKVVFPLELLPVITVTTALIHALIGVGVWLVGYTLLVGIPNATIFILPLVLICFVPLLLGLGWLLSSIGVFLKDVSHLSGMFSQSLLFLTPIFYSIDAVPLKLQALLMLNPLTFIVEQFRLVLFYGQMPALKSLLGYFVLASVFAWASYALFKRLRPNFPDMM